MLHVFQPLPIEETDLNPFELIGTGWAALTASGAGKVNCMTVSWGSLGTLWNKKVCQVYVRESRFTKEILDASDYFSLTFFPAKYKSTLKYLGAVSGRDENKFKQAKLAVNLHKEVPFIDDGHFVICCKKIAAIPMPLDCLPEDIKNQFYQDGDPHTMYVGEIIEMMAR